MFDLLYNAEKQADLDAEKTTFSSQPAPCPSMMTPAPALPRQYQQWQPDHSQWHSRSMAPAQSVWQSQEPAWVNSQFPGYTQSSSQQEVARRRSSQSDTFTTLVPSAESQHPRRSSSDPLHQEQTSFSLSQILMEMTTLRSQRPRHRPLSVTCPHSQPLRLCV